MRFVKFCVFHRTRIVLWHSLTITVMDDTADKSYMNCDGSDSNHASSEDTCDGLRSNERYPKLCLVGSKADNSNILRLTKRKGAILNDRLAHEIFNLKSDYLLHQHSSCPILPKGYSAFVAKLYGISPKTVRDIWNFRTWRHITLKPALYHNLHSSGLNCADAKPYPDTNVRSDPARTLYLDPPVTIPLALSIYESIRKPAGRPLGSKDKTPRRRVGSQEQSLLLSSAPTSSCPQFYAASAPMVAGKYADDEKDEYLGRTYPFFLNFD